MTVQLPLRPYQTEAIEALEAGWAEGLQRQAVVLPTGLGKTVVFAHLIHQSLAAGWTPLVLVHREELAEQAADKIRSVAPDVTVGIVKAERNELDAQVVVASVQTLSRPRRMGQYLGSTVGRHRLVIVDECHHAAARTWIETLEALGGFRPNGLTRVAGFTATMTREDSRKLGDIWERVALEKDILYGIGNGFLTDVRGKAVTVDGLDLGTVARSRGDYQDGALGEALEASGAGDVIAQSYLEHSADRQGVLFAPTVATALSFAEDLNAAGIVTETITGATSSEDRALIYKRYQAGDVQVLSNCMVLTEGWDAPWCSTAVIARPTSSAGLYVQMVGRVLRPWPGKTDALVLDVVGVTGRHKLRSLTDLTRSDVEVAEGESLAEAVERKAREDGRKPATKGQAAGIIGAQDVDLFAASESVWLQTTDGKWFIPTRDWTYFLWPEANATTWKIGRLPTYRLSREGVRGGWVREGLEIGYAMAFGEAEAAQADPSISKKSASWRTRKAAPSEAQVAMMAKWRIPYQEGMTKAQASDLISIAIATKDLSRFRYEPGH